MARGRGEGGEGRGMGRRLHCRRGICTTPLSLSLSPSLSLSLSLCLTPLSLGYPSPSVACVECLIGKQKKPILFKVTEPSSSRTVTNIWPNFTVANRDPISGQILVRGTEYRSRR
jgi:hypothetical protein